MLQGSSDRAHRYHSLLAEAIRNRDGSAAQTVISEHIEAVKRAWGAYDRTRESKERQAALRQPGTRGSTPKKGGIGAMKGKRIPLFVLALFLGYLAHHTNSLVAPITLHANFNGVSMVMLFVLVHFSEPAGVASCQATRSTATSQQPPLLHDASYTVYPRAACVSRPSRYCLSVRRYDSAGSRRPLARGSSSLTALGVATSILGGWP